MSENVTPKQQICIAALLTGATIEQAAGAASVSPRTVYRWMHEDVVFVEALQTAQEGLVLAAARKLSGLLGDGVDELSRLLKSSKLSTAQRLKAINAIFVNHVRLHELTQLDARLDRIEELLKW